MNYKKEDYNYMAAERRRALVMIAQKLGAEHKITQMMRCMSYGRNDAEQGPRSTLHTAIREMAFIDGCFLMLNYWARDNDREAQTLMIKLYPHGYAKRP